MQWWKNFVDWLTSSDAQPVVFAAVVLAVAVIVSGLLSAWIARGALRGLLTRTDRERKDAAIGALVDAAAEASAWNSLTPAEQVLSNRAVGQASVALRLLPIKGAATAARWAEHQLAAMMRSSAPVGYQLDPVVAEFRDRLVEWQKKPSRARKLFENDLERWHFESAEAEHAAAVQDSGQDAVQVQDTVQGPEQPVNSAPEPDQDQDQDQDQSSDSLNADANAHLDADNTGSFARSNNGEQSLPAPVPAFATAYEPDADREDDRESEAEPATAEQRQ